MHEHYWETKARLPWDVASFTTRLPLHRAASCGRGRRRLTEWKEPYRSTSVLFALLGDRPSQGTTLYASEGSVGLCRSAEPTPRLATFKCRGPSC